MNKFLIAIVCAAALFAGCVAQQPTASPTPQPTVSATPSAAPTPIPRTLEVRIDGYSFDPAEITIPVGTTVVWTNDDVYVHGVDFGDFGSEALDSGESYSYNFTEPGNYTYTCGVHGYSTERGAVHVVP